MYKLNIYSGASLLRSTLYPSCILVVCVGSLSSSFSISGQRLGLYRERLSLQLFYVENLISF